MQDIIRYAGVKQVLQQTMPLFPMMPLKTRAFPVSFLTGLETV